MPVCTFFHYKSMANISFDSNQSSYPIGTRTQLFVPLAYRCYLWNLVRIGFMASEEMSFENARSDDGRTTDGRRMPAHTISSPMSLRLMWAKKSNYVLCICIIILCKLMCIFDYFNTLHKNIIKLEKYIYFFNLFAILVKWNYTKLF